jgi:hypothetical protein
LASANAAAHIGIETQSIVDRDIIPHKPRLAPACVEQKLRTVN